MTKTEMLMNRSVGAGRMNNQEERTEKRTETYACDSISRQAAIDAFEDTTFTKNEIRRRLSELPPAQPEINRCKNCKNLDNDFGCDMCGEIVTDCDADIR